MEIQELITSAVNYEKKIGVSYQLRYDPLIDLAKNFITEKQQLGPMSSIIEWGSDLSIWHPWEDYRNSYAANSNMGGGVTLTMSHEIDLARYLFGSIIHVSAHTQTAPLFGLKCDSVVDALFIHESGTSTILHLDFFQRPPKRTLRVISEFEVMELDLIDRSFTVQNSDGTFISHRDIDYDPNLTYKNSLAAFISACNSGPDYKTDLFDGCKTAGICLSMLDSAKVSKVIHISKENTRAFNV